MKTQTTKASTAKTNTAALPFFTYVPVALLLSALMATTAMAAPNAAQKSTEKPTASNTDKKVGNQAKSGASDTVMTGASKKQDQPSTDGQSADDYVKKIQSFYDTTKDYQATFVQTYADIAAGTTSVAKGKVYIKQPGKMRWDYYKNGQREKLYVSNGRDFWAYEYRFKQAFKQCLKGSQLKTSLSFLMGSGDLQKEFNVKLHKKSTPQHPMLRLQPKEPTSKFKELVFTIDPESGQVVETIIYDPYGNSNTIQFLKVKRNTDLPDSGFEFKPPADARVLNPDQRCE